ncbi:hypothetical protein GGX14DRAFT_428971 [Mycena pura]|uniref:Uncharacterized protein n=1 Tax=Mycena pura TaxID=153505 RepID=A0AAD6YLE3_9AGAR|nr:hypothetical protein GGX14DRAFT_428971 [Mycena pura]
MSSDDLELFSLRDDYFNFTLVQIFCNGVYSVVFFIALYGMIFKRKTHKLLVAVIILMYILATIQTGIDWANLRVSFVDNGASPGDVVNSLLQETYLWTVAPASMLVANTFLADCVLIFRCFAIWNHNWRVVVLPIMSTLGGTTLGVLVVDQTARYVASGGDPNSFVDFAIPYIAMCLATTLLATTLIVFRIVWLTRARAGAGTGALSAYRVVIEMVVESALLYAVTLIVYLALLFGPPTSNSDGYAQAILVHMTGIAPTLIVARVSFGLARPSSSWQRTSKRTDYSTGKSESESGATATASTELSKNMQFSANEDIESRSVGAGDMKEHV